MLLVSVNIGHEHPIQNGKASGKTGIYKLPTSEAVRITTQGIGSDFIADLENHGGPDQAIYAFGQPDYDWWSGELGRELAPGTFGENLTIGGLESAGLSIGDKLRIGPVILQVTAARIPCVTLAARMGDPAFVKRFRHAERPGAYCRVLQEGSLRAGDEVQLQPYPGETITVLEMFRDWYEPDESDEWARRYRAAPVAIRARREK
jgi:MOSC domain-containing protein YiiM